MESELRKDLVLELTLRFMSASARQKQTNKNKQKTINDKLKQHIVAASLYPHSNKYILKTKQHWQSIHKKDKQGFLVSSRLVLFSTAEDKFNTQVRAQTSSWGLLTDTEVNVYISGVFSWQGYGGGGSSGGGSLTTTCIFVLKALLL